MEFFDKLAQMVIDLVVGTWGFMKMIAGKMINSTFGWYTGKPITEEMAALFVYGALICIIAVYLFFGRALKFNK
jgi:hypothetical protein